MFKRLLLIVCGLVVLAGCVKPPVEDLAETRRVVAYVYASGASRLAPEEYRIASEALRGAEQFVKQGDYRQAQQGLARAKKYSTLALSLSVHRKALYAEEQKKQEELRVREIAEQKAQKMRKSKPVEKVVGKPLLPPAPVADPEPQLVDQVEVSGEKTLASISAREEVYLDPLLWPLIYKANRDQIKDPQQIFPGQILLIPRDKTTEELEAARLEARELNLF